MYLTARDIQAEDQGLDERLPVDTSVAVGEFVPVSGNAVNTRRARRLAAIRVEGAKARHCAMMGTTRL